MQLERFNPDAKRAKSLLDKLPVFGKRREQRRIERGEDPLSLMVIRKLMSDLESGFTVSHVMNRELYAGNSAAEMAYVTDTSHTTQEQKVILRGKDGKSYRVKLRSGQSKEGSSVSHNELSLSVRDNIEEGPQRFIAFYKTQAKPSFLQRRHEEHAGREFYGIHTKNWTFDSWFKLAEDTYPKFLQEILESVVDIEATQEDFDRFELERQTQSTPRSHVMKSVALNQRPANLLR